ncbi:MAG TPA: LacI family DNA-binding transcriptional regulator [Acidothermaceae bacterium]|nr:LacI family DNA-binding transcriptional regulator [Acidothermaceae bacterium]
MTDVARVAGVSHMTVSRVLNEPELVRPLTRARVLAAIEQLGYRPNLAARALVTGRTQTLGVVTFDTTLYGPASTLYGIEQAATNEGYSVTVAAVSGIDRASVHDGVSRLVSQGVDGVILVVPLMSAAEAISGVAKDVPLVAVEGDPGVGIPVVMCDQFTGAKTATAHLLDSGHETVWHVAGPSNWMEAEGRITGWRAALDAAKAEQPPPISGDWSAKSGYEAGAILARMPDVTAVFAANDQMALGVMRAFTERGRLIPDDVSVVGYDDIPEAGYFTPPLTTVRQDFARVGENAIRLMIEQISSDQTEAADQASPAKVVIESVLVVRESTAPRPDRRPAKTGKSSSARKTAGG